MRWFEGTKAQMREAVVEIEEDESIAARPQPQHPQPQQAAKYSFLVPDDLDRLVRAIAKERGVTLSHAARDVLRTGAEHIARGPSPVELPPEHAQRAEALCAALGVDAAVLVRMCLLRYLGEILDAVEAPGCPPREKRT